MFRRRRTNDDPGGSGKSEDVYLGLRRLALESVANGLELPSAEHPDVSGVVVDVPSGGSFATIVALTDDTTSMYTSTGGGTLGSGAHHQVAAATHRLLSAVQAQLEAFTSVDRGELPPPGSVRFHVLTATGSRFEDVPEDCFWGRSPHPLLPVIASAQEVVSAIREASPQ
jgi:hypothetical protein